MKKSPLAIVAAAVSLAGCVSENPAVQTEIDRLVQENRFDDARNVYAKNAWAVKGGEAKKRDQQFSSFVNSEEAKFAARRIKALREVVLADLKAGNDAEARRHIYEFGIAGHPGDDWVPQPTSNGLVFAAKCGLLNSRVNPATYKRLKDKYGKEVSDAIGAGDFRRAVALVAELKPVSAYPESIDPLLDRAAAEALAQRAERKGVETLVATTKGAIYDMTAYREGYEKTDFDPNWAKVRGTLDEVLDALVADDVPLLEAQNLVDSLLYGVKALFNDDETGENMTTAQLNEAIATLRDECGAKVNEALAAAIAAAGEADEETTSRLVEIQKTLARQALTAIDPASRAATFVGAIGSCTDPAMNRILGDAARAMRLFAEGGAVSPDDANSLLAASIFMGFADTAKLAISLKADVNGFSPKDNLRRTPLLLSLQFGSKGRVGPILANADRTIRDAAGYGAIHYAVRYGTEATLQTLINLGLDAKTAASDGVTPLMVAADMGNVAFAQALVALSDLNAADDKGRTALHFAAKSGSLPIVRTLIRHGADANAVTADGVSVLDIAVELSSERMIAFLLDDAKASLDERAIAGCARASSGKVMPLAALVAHGGVISDRNLADAVAGGNLDMVKYLVGLGCDVNAAEVREAVSQSGATDAILDFLSANGYRENDAAGDFVRFK